MKRFVLFLLLFTLLFAGCTKREKGAPAADLVADSVIDALHGEARFHAADADYTEMSFDFAPLPTESALYFGEEFGVEIGVFSFESAAAAERGAATIKNYLSREADAVRDLAALYPADELTARLARYAHATVLVEGNTAAYFLLPDTERPLAEEAFLEALK